MIIRINLHELEERLLPHWLPGDHHFNLMLTMVIIIMVMIIMVMIIMVMIIMVMVMVNIYLMMIEMPDWSK